MSERIKEFKEDRKEIINNQILKIVKLEKVIFVFGDNRVVFYEENGKLKIDCQNEEVKEHANNGIKSGIHITIPRPDLDKKWKSIGAREEYTSKVETVYDIFYKKQI